MIEISPLNTIRVQVGRGIGAEWSTTDKCLPQNEIHT